MSRKSRAYYDHVQERADRRDAALRRLFRQSRGDVVVKVRAA